jgi:regulator of protease activity HflC (stomatin/prohibitin superfamily)
VMELLSKSMPWFGIRQSMPRGGARRIIGVVDWHEAVRQAALTALRDTIGQSEFDYLLKNRLSANLDLKRLLCPAVEKRWVEVASVELEHLESLKTCGAL